jgi:hypothetical protein
MSGETLRGRPARRVDPGAGPDSFADSGRGRGVDELAAAVAAKVEGLDQATVLAAVREVFADAATP